MPLCGGFKIGVEKQRAEDAAVGDRERSALEVVDRDRPFARLGREGGDGLLDRGEREPVGVADDRHHQPALGAHGHADVVVVVVDDLVAVDPALTAGKAFKASTAALTKNDMKPSDDAVLLLKSLLVLVAQRHDARHVGFVEGRQDRRGLLGLDQSLRRFAGAASLMRWRVSRSVRSAVAAAGARAGRLLRGTANSGRLGRFAASTPGRIEVGQARLPW